METTYLCLGVTQQFFHSMQVRVGGTVEYNGINSMYIDICRTVHGILLFPWLSQARRFKTDIYSPFI